MIVEAMKKFLRNEYTYFEDGDTRLSTRPYKVEVYFLDVNQGKQVRTFLEDRYIIGKWYTAEKLAKDYAYKIISDGLTSIVYSDDGSDRLVLYPPHTIAKVIIRPEKDAG